MMVQPMGANSHLGPYPGRLRDNHHTGDWNNFTNGQYAGVFPVRQRPRAKRYRVIFLNIRSP